MLAPSYGNSLMESKNQNVRAFCISHTPAGQGILAGEVIECPPRRTQLTLAESEYSTLRRSNHAENHNGNPLFDVRRNYW